MANIQITNGTNVNDARSESYLIINPNDPRQIVAGSKKFKDIEKYDFTIATLYSVDSGGTWYSSEEVDITGWDGLSDPALAWDDIGNVFLVGLPFINPPENDKIGIAVYKSIDGGKTWSAPNLIHESASDDKQWAAGDTNPASPFHGRVYAVWDDGRAMTFARTLDHGNTWTVARLPVNDSKSPEINVAADGTIYILWRAGSEIKMIVSKNGGESFDVVRSPAKGITPLFDGGIGKFPGGTFRVLTLPTACVGLEQTVIVAWADYRDDISRIYFARSTDGGASWITGTSGQPLLTHSFSVTQQHFHPQIVMDSEGVIGCAFYEFGPKPRDFLIDVIMTLSFDAGGSFSPPFRVTDQPWDPAIGAPWVHGDCNLTFIGEYFGFDANKRTFYPLWTDTRTGIQELFLDIVRPVPVIDLPESIGFGNVHQRETATRVMEITNRGSAPLSFSIEASPAPPPGQPRSGFWWHSAQSVISPGENHDFVVNFTPRALGNFTGTLQVESNAMSEPRSVKLGGRGIPGEPS
jgi:HYDIN/CFA65/VesB family protein